MWHELLQKVDQSDFDIYTIARDSEALGPLRQYLEEHSLGNLPVILAPERVWRRHELRRCGGTQGLSLAGACLAGVLATQGCGPNGEPASAPSAAESEEGAVIAIAASVRRFAYESVDFATRTSEVALEEDLVIRGGEAAPLLGVTEIDVDESGNVFALEYSTRTIRVFSATGEATHVLGRRGQGPGELQEPTALAATGDSVIVADGGHRRLIEWSLNGTFRDDRSYGVPSSIDTLHSVGGTLLVSFVQRPSVSPSCFGNFVVALVSRDGSLTNEITQLCNPRPIGVDRSVAPGLMLGRKLPEFGSQYPSVVASKDRFCVSGRKTYQVVCYEASGASLWEVTVPLERVPISDSEKQQAVAGLTGRYAGASVDDVLWPPAHPAVRRIALDGSGNLYVFPILADAEGHDDVPVDVYSPGGERILAGRIADHPWVVAGGDYVYAVEKDLEADEDRIVRYSLTLR